MTSAKKFLGESLIRDDRPTLLLAAYRPFTPLTREDQTTEPLTVATRHRELVDRATPHPQSHWQIGVAGLATQPQRRDRAHYGARGMRSPSPGAQNGTRPPN